MLTTGLLILCMTQALVIALQFDRGEYLWFCHYTSAIALTRDDNA